MEIKWVESDCVESKFPYHDVWKTATIGQASITLCKERNDRQIWIAWIATRSPYTTVNVHRATEAEALADVLDLARRCGMVAE